MKLSQIVVKEAVIPELQAQDRDGVIKEMVNKLVEVSHLSGDDTLAVVRALIKREKQGSTGFGKGVAVPHVKHAAAKKLVATIGRSSVGVDFAALDRAPVYVVVLLLSPPDMPDEHLEAMESIFRYLQRDNFRKFLRQAETIEQIAELIEEADEIPAG